MSELSPQGGSEGYGACDDEVRVERCGKSAPDGWRLSVAVNSIRSNTGMGAGGSDPQGWPGRSRGGWSVSATMRRDR